LAAADSSEKSVFIYHGTEHHSPEECNVNAQIKFTVYQSCMKLLTFCNKVDLPHFTCLNIHKIALGNCASVPVVSADQWND
jgi:hypothetical protein